MSQILIRKRWMFRSRSDQRSAIDGFDLSSQLKQRALSRADRMALRFVPPDQALELHHAFFLYCSAPTRALLTLCCPLMAVLSLAGARRAARSCCTHLSLFLCSQLFDAAATRADSRVVSLNLEWSSDRDCSTDTS